MKSFVVIGLGRFGSNLAGTVVKRGKIVYSSQTNEVYKL